MKVTDKFKVKILIAFALFGVIIVIWGIIDFIIDQHYLSKDYKYTISKKVSLGSFTRTGSQRKYTFIVKSKIYSGITSTHLNTNRIYFIKYYPPDPERNEATLVVANENDIKNLPPDGYKELPHK